MSARVALIVSGRVQGVGYRYSACARAQVLGVTGWVRNLPDGRVGLVAEGPQEAVNAFIEWCGQGPAFASVADVQVTERSQAEPEYKDFSVRN